MPSSFEIYLQTAYLHCCISQHTSLRVHKPDREVSSGSWSTAFKGGRCACSLASKILHAAGHAGRLLLVACGIAL